MASDNIVSTFRASSLDGYLRIMSAFQQIVAAEGRDADHPLFLFRGMKQNAEFRASIAQKCGEDAFLKDKQMFREFRKRIVANDIYVDNPTDLDIFAVARHYGLPNRSLDFSANPLVALWFAIHGLASDGHPVLSKGSSHPVVWRVQTVLADFVDDYSVSLFPKKAKGKTFFYRARNDIPRIQNQGSFLMRQVFVYPHGKRTGRASDMMLEFVDKNPTFRARVSKIEILGCIKEYDEFLNQQGIIENYVIPDKGAPLCKRLNGIVEDVMMSCQN